jgi:hypothetical protein
MYISKLYSLTEFLSQGEKFTLPSNMMKYIEFENTVVFLLDNNGKPDKVVGVKFSQEGGVNHLYIAWEFQDINGLGQICRITGMFRETYNGKEVVSCFVGRRLTEYFLNPDNGEILFERYEK